MTSKWIRTSAGADKVRALTDADFALVKAWLYGAAGISLTSAKKALVQGRLSRRLSELGFSAVGDYIGYLTSAAGGQERQIAINALTTNETYFFREPAHFDFIEQLALSVWDKYQKCRVWSAASSTGEEAYTVGMTMAAAGVHDWEVIGTDINSEVIAQAAKGVYPIQRASKIPERQLKRYCLKGVGSMEGFFQISSEIRQSVSFQQGNILKKQLPLGLFDVIMLRNVLIYFDKTSKQQVLNSVLRHLKPGGYLLIGHAESLNGLDHELANIKPSVYRADS